MEESSCNANWQRRQSKILEALLLEILESGESVEITPEFWEQRRQTLLNRMREQQQ